MSVIWNPLRGRPFPKSLTTRTWLGPKHFSLILFLLLVLAPHVLRAQGPPFQTDDPVPVDFQHYEFYIFGGMDGTPAEIDSTGPAFEFNWGALPRVQLHIIAPWGAVNPSNNPIYAPGGIGPLRFRLHGHGIRRKDRLH